MKENSLNDTELNELTMFIQETCDFDFSGYTSESLKRRFVRLMTLKNFSSIFEFKYAITNQQISRTELLNEISVNVTEMFRDPSFYKALVKDVFPYLESFPQFKVWHAGCSSGQEMYSLAILMEEKNLRQKSIQFGTDINRKVLEEAKKGIYPLSEIKIYTENYNKSGGETSLSNFYTAMYGNAKMNNELKEKMVFSAHNLVEDTSFNEFQLIVCRNVLIYFDEDLKNHVLQLFIDSLAPYGYLVLGNKESPMFSEAMKSLEVINGRERIYRKKGIIAGG